MAFFAKFVCTLLVLSLPGVGVYTLITHDLFPLTVMAGFFVILVLSAIVIGSIVAIWEA